MSLLNFLNKGFDQNIEISHINVSHKYIQVQVALNREKRFHLIHAVAEVFNITIKYVAVCYLMKFMKHPHGLESVFDHVFWSQKVEQRCLEVSAR